MLFLLASCGPDNFAVGDEAVADVDGSAATDDEFAADSGTTADASIPTAAPAVTDADPAELAVEQVATEEVFYVDEACDSRFFPGFPPDQAWCFEDWALATVDGFGIELASYRLVDGAAREIGTGPIIGQIDIGETLNLGIPLRVAEELCRRAAETRLASADNCQPHSSASSAALAFVQSHLWRIDETAPVTDAARAEAASVRTGLEFSPFLNRLASWERAGASDGCWLKTGTIAAQCAIDIRGFNGTIVDTIVVSAYPQGVVDQTFVGFTGQYEIIGVTTSLAAAGINLDNWVLTASSFGPVAVGISLRDAQNELGFGLDLAGSSPDGAAADCYFATPIGFVGLFYIVKADAGSEPLDGVIQSIVVSAPDYPAASGIRVGTSSDALVVTLGDELIPRDHASSANGRYFDMPETPEAERLLRFESYDGITISQLRAGLSAAVTAVDGCS